MRTVSFTLVITLLFTMFPVHVFAESKELPDMKLPDTEPLETPKLSKDFNELIKELEKQGFGKYANDPDKKIKLPEVKSPAGNEGKNAYDKFVEDHGDMKNDPNRQLDKSSGIPDDQYFESIYEYAKENKKEFDRISQANRDEMASLLKKELNKSFLYDLEGIKQNFSKRFLSNAQASSYLAGTPKQAGWDEVKRISFIVPKMPELKMRDVKPILLPPIPLFRWGNTTQPPKNTQANAQPQAQYQAQEATSKVTSTQPSTEGVRVPNQNPGGVSVPGNAPGVGVPGRNRQSEQEGKSWNPTPTYNPAPAYAASTKESLWSKTKSAAATAAKSVATGLSWVGTKVKEAGTAIANDIKSNPTPYIVGATVAAGVITVATGGYAAPLFKWLMALAGSAAAAGAF